MADTVRVLHVDDDAGVRELAAEFLEREAERFDVVLANSAATGLERIEQERPDCIVSDYDMPETDGIEFLQAVREEYPDLPFVLFTGKGSEEVASDAISAGATDYLQKQSGSEQYELLANRVENAVEQYRSQRELERERSRMQFALDSTDAAIWTLDVETEVMEIHPTVCPLFDTEIESFAAFLDQIHPDARSRVRETVRAAARASEPYSVQFRYPADGETHWGEMTGRTIQEDGQVSFQTGITRDITTQKERKRRFEMLTSNLPGMVYRCRNEPNWPMEDVRGDVAEFSGYTAAELETGETEWGGDVIHPDDRNEVWGTVQQALDDRESFELTYRIVAAGGETRWVWERGEGVYGPEDELEAIEGFITDITERRRHEKNLETVRDRMEFALARTNSVIWEVDPETGSVTSYPDPCPLYGRSVETTDQFYAGVYEADRPEVEAAFRDARETGEGRTVEFRTTPDIDPEWIECQIQPLTADESVSRLVGVSRDISEYKRRERQLERQNDQFDQLASVVSHDLQTPISTVRGRLQLATETGDLSHVEDAQTAIQRLDELRQDLIEMLRAREVVGEAEPLDVAELATAAWESINRPADSMFDVTGSPVVEGDPDATRRLLQNLLSNTVEHADDHTAVRIGSCDGGFYVEDDGPGIDPENREAVFTPGFSTKSGGTGMGMASVKQIVDEHGWEIVVTEAETLDGARFEITA